MKKQSLVLVVFVLSFSSFFYTSCKKINEATELGSDLIPPVDNVTTFETFLETQTDNQDLSTTDTTILLNDDVVAVGHISSDPEFGQTHANAYFNISSTAYGTYPFVERNTVAIDSVVLSLAYTGGYADTNATQTIRVFEIAQNAGLHDTTFYKYTNDDLLTTGAELGSKTFMPTTLDDSIPIIRKDTQMVANVVRIRLDNSLGNRFASYDTTGATAAFKNDSIFQTLFRGLAIKADQSGNTISYFNLFDQTNTKLSVYFSYTKDSKKDTATAEFTHVPVPYSTFTHPAGVVNTVKRTKGGNWATYANNGNPQDDKLYIQSAPGSYAAIKVPSLDTMTNKVVHLAELIAYQLPSALETTFTGPSMLFLDHKNAHVNGKDSAFLFENDLAVASTGQVNLAAFGGTLRKNDKTYRFNITRYVQNILTRKDPNDTLRLYAPLRSTLYNKTTGGQTTISVLDEIANGRVVVAGGNYADAGMRLRLRIVYSEL